VAIAAAHGTILRYTDEIVGRRPETEIDVLAVLQGELGPAAVVIDLLDVGRQVVVGQPVPVRVQVTQNHEFVGVVEPP